MPEASLLTCAEVSIIVGVPGVIALVDGEHHPAAVRTALDRLEAERGLAGVVFCGGEEKLSEGVLDDAAVHYGRRLTVAATAADGLREAATAARARAVVDLADEPVLGERARLGLAALALHLGLDYEAPGLRLSPQEYTPLRFDGRAVAVIGTGKRTGKTAVAGHLARLLQRAGREAVIVCPGRGGPDPPRVARPGGIGLDELVALSDGGHHAASDYLEGALLAEVTTVGCRRVGGGPAGQPAESNVAEGALLAASLGPEVVILEGSGSCVPEVKAHRTVCVVGRDPDALEGLARYRLLRTDLALVPDDRLADAALAAGATRALPFALRPEAAEPVPEGARTALFTTGVRELPGVEPVVSSQALGRRSELARALARAAAERCDVYLTELKAAAVDSVAADARKQGARVIFVRNVPVAARGDLDAELVALA